ncbi:unnamed protein product [Timema podura]|uniref:ZAD domain-containing protein n=1 Tax=Timema podura TaxID=61482 RepID=A0ABN7NWS5_TIMPD|nr:unnamed protein product [Timema podura]
MTKMSSLNYMELCRLCLVKEKVSVPIFEGEGGERQIFDKIATCLPVKVSQDDKLPKKICSDCVYRVENSYQFWNTTSNSEKQLLEWVVNDVKVDSKNLVSDNITMETEQVRPFSLVTRRSRFESRSSVPRVVSHALRTDLVLKEEAIDHDQTAADVAKSLSRVEAVLTEETGQPGGVSEEEEEEEDSDDGGGGGGGEDSNSEESGEEPPGKEEIESEEEEEEEEPYEELEPTTFVNVSLACDEAGPSGIQQTRQQTKQDSQTSAASASATTANAEAPSTSAADPAASGHRRPHRLRHHSHLIWFSGDGDAGVRIKAAYQVRKATAEDLSKQVNKELCEVTTVNEKKEN